MIKELSSIKKSLEKSQDLEKDFKPIRPFVKKYYEKKKK